MQRRASRLNPEGGLRLGKLSWGPALKDSPGNELRQVFFRRGDCPGAAYCMMCMIIIRSNSHAAQRLATPDTTQLSPGSLSFPRSLSCWGPATRFLQPQPSCRRCRPRSSRSRTLRRARATVTSSPPRQPAHARALLPGNPPKQGRARRGARRDQGGTRQDTVDQGEKMLDTGGQGEKQLDPEGHGGKQRDPEGHGGTGRHKCGEIWVIRQSRTSNYKAGQRGARRNTAGHGGSRRSKAGKGGTRRDKVEQGGTRRKKL